MPKIGAKNAYKIFVDNHRRPKNVFKYFRSANQQGFSQEYIETFEKAFLTFRFQRVWCPVKNKIVSLNSLEDLDIFTADQLLEKYSHYTPENIQKEVEELKDIGLLLKYAQRPEKLNFLGEILEQGLAEKIARCEYDPCSKEPFEPPQTRPGMVTDKHYQDFQNKINSRLAFRQARENHPATLHAHFAKSQSNTVKILSSQQNKAPSKKMEIESNPEDEDALKKLEEEYRSEAEARDEVSFRVDCLTRPFRDKSPLRIRLPGGRTIGGSPEDNESSQEDIEDSFGDEPLEKDSKVSQVSDRWLPAPPSEQGLLLPLDSQEPREMKERMKELLKQYRQVDRNESIKKFRQAYLASHRPN